MTAELSTLIHHGRTFMIEVTPTGPDTTDPWSAEVAELGTAAGQPGYQWVERAEWPSDELTYATAALALAAAVRQIADTVADDEEQPR